VLRDSRLQADIVARAGKVYEQLRWEITSRVYLEVVGELAARQSSPLSR
jgi:hypothetical protein